MLASSISGSKEVGLKESRGERITVLKNDFKTQNIEKGIAIMPKERHYNHAKRSRRFRYRPQAKVSKEQKVLNFKQL